VAIPASLIFLIQTILTFVGADASDGLSADFDGDLDANGGPSQVFSFRNLINFLLGFSWTGISFFHLLESKLILIGLSFSVGIAFVAVFFIIIKQIQKLAEDNTFQLKSTVAKTAEVYLTIPANKSGIGKIMISINGAMHELDAITENEESLKTGSLVKILNLDGNLLIVDKL